MYSSQPNQNTWPTTLLVVLTTAAIMNAAEEPNDKQHEFFESRIRPVLVEHCYECHSASSDEIKGALVVDTREGIRRGGDSGEAVIPNDVQDSLLISALKYDAYEMPPSGPLPRSVIRDFERWIRMGAPDPRNGKAVETSPAIDLEKGREFWAFQPVTDPLVPSTNDQAWPITAIDQFVLAKLEDNGLHPVSDADRPSWIRRVSFDLTGLPPTTDQIDEFIDDTSSDAFEKVVDRLLDSAQFGERWGRHWLDVARYGETMGKTRNLPLTFAWRYRDYVIDSFNNDTPYDQFVREQLAGDLMSADNESDQARQLIATGFLAIGSHDLNEGNVRQYEMDVVGEQIDTISRSLLGLTVGCARCHDHKFDPIPTADYYALAGIFRSTEILNGYANKKRNANYFVKDAFHSLPGAGLSTEPSTANSNEDTNDEFNAAAVRFRKQLDRVKQQQIEVRKNNDLPRPELAEQLATLNRRQRQIQKKIRQANQRPNGRKPPSGAFAMGVRDREAILDCKINLRGDPTKLGGRVDRGFIQVASLARQSPIPDSASGRLELADWLTNGQHPLTARVMVNRIWQHMFGSGLVRTVDNFGEMGERPSHPELLDHLAGQFMQDGWSVKRLIRTIALSHTYRLSSDYDESNAEVDGDSRLLWRVTRRRLDAESIRDSIMSASGKLELNRPQRSPVAELPISENGRINRSPFMIDEPYRSVYLPIIRNALSDFFTVFDFPDPSEVRGKRDVTTVPTQALFMMNNPFVAEQAEFAATQLLGQTESDRVRVELAYRQTLSRLPTDEEIVSTVAFTNSAVDNDENQSIRSAISAWAEVYQALFASAEFRYR